MAHEKLHQQQIEELVIKAQHGDMDAYGQLYDAFIDPIYRYIFFRVNKDEAFDLTENVFLKMWENLQSYRPRSEAFFSSWLFRIAHNVVVDHYRGRKENVSLDIDLPDTKRHHNPIIMTEQKLGQEALQIAIGKLKKKYQQVIILKYINELENEEIANILGCTEGSLRIIKFRALRALREVLQSMNIEY